VRPHLLIATLLAIATLCAFLLAGRDARAFPLPFVETREPLVEAALSVAAADHVDAREFADAVAQASNGNRDWAALLITIAAHESALSARIAENRCEAWECDATHVGGKLVHRAAGLFQEHRNLNNLTTWGSTDVGVQVASASRALRRAYWTCARHYPKGVSAKVWVSFTINAFAGKSCDREWRGGEEREATWRAVRRRL